MDIETAYRRFFPLIREKCARMLGSAEAQDVAQETFIRLWRAGVAFDAPARVVGWAYRTSTRLAIDVLRGRAHAPPPVADAHAGGAEAKVWLAQALRELSRRMPADELEVVILDRIDGMTQPEIAEVAGISERTVRRVLARADERLAALKAEVLA